MTTEEFIACVDSGIRDDFWMTFVWTPTVRIPGADFAVEVPTIVLPEGGFHLMHSNTDGRTYFVAENGVYCARIVDDVCFGCGRHSIIMPGDCIVVPRLAIN